MNKIQLPADLKELPREQLSPLCEEIRAFLIENLSKGGGHLSSNLGTVELTIALHRVFDSPKDQIVWDVGHQAYTHKLLTGRKQRFSTLRKKDGLSGFPSPKESPHDIITTGHSSTSLPAAFGLARAKTIQGENGHVIAVVGDGAAGGGLFYEGLNNIGRYHDRLIVILNDNKVSISKNIGGFAKYLSEIRVRPRYFKAKDRIERIVTEIPLIGKGMRRWFIRSKSMLKYALYHNTWFEEFGFTYLGPVDGHDVHSLCEVLERAKSLNRPVFVHVETVKGKGYRFAEENPGAYHGVRPFDPQYEMINHPSEGFSAEFGEILVELAKKDSRICALSPAMKYATGLDAFAAAFPRRFIDVGIAEPLSVTCAAGMAKNGLIPVIAIYSTFLQRAYDQVLNDAAVDGLHLVLAIDRAGIVGEDGETHQGIFDVAFLSTIPNVTIFAPTDFNELRDCLERAIYRQSGIVAVRYPKTAAINVPTHPDELRQDWSLYRSSKNRAGRLIITYGRTFLSCYNAALNMEKQDNGSDVLKLLRLGADSEIEALMQTYREILFVEEGVSRGSVSEYYAGILESCDFPGKYRAHTLGETFIAHQTVEQAFAEYQMDAAGIEEKIKELFA